eukprot:104059_1
MPIIILTDTVQLQSHALQSQINRMIINNPLTIMPYPIPPSMLIHPILNYASLISPSNTTNGSTIQNIELFNKDTKILFYYLNNTIHIQINDRWFCKYLLE